MQDVQTGKVIGKDFVGWKKNPAVGRLKDATQMLNTIGIQLGLSPKSRAELFKTVQSKKEEGSTVKSIQEFFVSNKKRQSLDYCFFATNYFELFLQPYFQQPAQ